MRLQQS